MADNNTLPRPNTPNTPVTPVTPPVQGGAPTSPYIGQGQRVTPPQSSGFKVTTTPSAPAAPTAAWKPTPVTVAPSSVAAATFKPTIPTAAPGQPVPATATKPSLPPNPVQQPVKPAPVIGVKPSTPVVGAAVGGTVVGATATNLASKPGQPKPLGAPPSVPGKPVPPTANAGAGAPPPRPVEPKKSILRFLPFLLLGALILGIIGFAIYWFMGRNAAPENQATNNTNSAGQKKKLVYWGLWEPTNVMEQVIADFEKANPDYDVQYVQQNHQQYRERLQAEIAKGTGPDVFRFHGSWVPMLQNELSPLPEKIMSKEEFSQTFYPSAVQALTSKDQLVGIPFMYEGLGLYYNKDIFTIANLTPPKNWEEMKNVSSLLTIRSGNRITRGGAALGTATNVEHFPEIVALLMLQNGADPINPTTPEAIEALRFYTDFAEKLNVWDTTLPNATVAFAKGDVAMMIAPSWRAHEVKAANANLQFDIVPVPQLPDKSKVSWASFWAEGVSEKSKDKEAAWKLVEYISSAEVQKKFYSEATKVRAFGEIYSRKDLGDELASKQYVGAYVQDAPFSKTGYMNGFTHDNGINDRIIKYYLDAINKGQASLAQSVVTVKQGIDQVLGDFAITSTP